MSARKRGEGVQEGERERQDRPFRDPHPEVLLPPLGFTSNGL